MVGRETALGPGINRDTPASPLPPEASDAKYPRMSDRGTINLNIHVHLGDVAQIVAPIVLALIDRRAIINLLQELKTMSGTQGAQLTQLQAETVAALDAVTTQLTEISDDVDRLLAGQVPGDPVTPEMVAAQTAIRDRVTAARDAMQAINTKGGEPPVTSAP